MQIPVQQFPVLTPGQMNPYNQAFQSGLSSYGDIVKQAYARPKEQADIMSKAAYAAYTPNSYIAKALSDPLVFGQMTPEQRQKAITQLTSMPTNPMDVLQPGYGQQSNATSTGGGLWDWAKTLFQGDQQSAASPTAAPANNNVAPSDNSEPPMTGQQAYDYVQKYNHAGENNPSASGNVAPAPTASPAPAVDLSDPSMNAFNQDFGSAQANSAAANKYPSPKQKAATAGATATMTANANVQAKALQGLQDSANTEAKNAYNLQQDAEKFHQAYQNATIKGAWALIPGISKLAQFDPNSRIAMNSANNMAVSLASQLFGAKQSDYREKLAQTLKLGIDMPEKTENQVFNGIEAMSKRAQQHSDFIQFAKSVGVSDPNQINNMWFDYNRDRPFYDIKKKSVLDKNLTPESYQQYLGKRLTGQSNTLTPAQEDETEGLMRVEHNGKTYYRKDGKWATL